MEVDFFRFFLICKFIQRYIQVIIAKLALQSVLIRGFLKLFAFKACLHICVKGHFAGMNLRGFFCI